MNFNKLFDFLSELEKNNSKVWMDSNRKRYKEIRTEFINWLDDLDNTLADIDQDYYPTPGKKGINRINNNLMFHPHKPIYKDHFGAGLDKAPGAGDFYIQIGINESLLAGGVWRPDPKSLRSIRDAIDYNGEELIKIINKDSFKKDMEGEGTFNAKDSESDAIRKQAEQYGLIQGDKEQKKAQLNILQFYIDSQLSGIEIQQ